MLRRKKIAVILTTILSTFILISCSTKNNTGVFNETTLNNKEQGSEHSYSIDSDKLIINGGCGDLVIKQSDTDEVKISIEQDADGKSKEELQKTIDNIKCTLKDDTINIGSDDNSYSDLDNLKASILIPKHITSLDIVNNAGDADIEGNFNDFKADMKKGDLSYKGDLKQCNILSDDGIIKLNLQHLDSNYRYELDGKFGDVDITIPKENSINLTSIENVAVENGIKFNKSSATFDINKGQAHTKIHN